MGDGAWAILEGLGCVSDRNTKTNANCFQYCVECVCWVLVGSESLVRAPLRSLAQDPVDLYLFLKGSWMAHSHFEYSIMAVEDGPVNTTCNAVCEPPAWVSSL